MLGKSSSKCGPKQLLLKKGPCSKKLQNCQMFELFLKKYCAKTCKNSPIWSHCLQSGKFLPNFGDIWLNPCILSTGRDQILKSFTTLEICYAVAQILIASRCKILKSRPSICSLCLKMGHPVLFYIYFQSFKTNSTIFTTNQCAKMSTQCTVLGLEPTTFRL